jgi:hypothetical protein
MKPVLSHGDAARGGPKACGRVRRCTPAGACAVATLQSVHAAGASRSIGACGQAAQVVYNRRDALLYALGVGADELRFTYELGRRTAPTGRLRPVRR